MRKLKVLDLFSGIGGFSLGLERTGYFETVAFCEIEDFPRRVLAKHWPEVPCHTDVRKLKGADIGAVDVICGGYPCQPFSTAGKRRGKEDDRHLWPEFNRLVAELRPSWVIGENVAGHISMGLDSVLSDLEGQGYACRTFVIPACAVDAPHRRDRCWTIGHRDRDRDLDREPIGAINDEAQGLSAMGCTDCTSVGHEGADVLAGSSDNVADADDTGPQGRQKAGHIGRIGSRGNKQPQRRRNDPGYAWCPQSRVGGMAHGLSCWMDDPAIGRVAQNVPDRSHRLKALGNAVVPQIPEIIGHAIAEAEGMTPAIGTQEQDT